MEVCSSSLRREESGGRKGGSRARDRLERGVSVALLLPGEGVLIRIRGLSPRNPILQPVSHAALWLRRTCSMRHLVLVALAALICGGTSGCSIFPESMQPHQLWKWNRNPGPRQDPFFAVPDPIHQKLNREQEATPAPNMTVESPQS